MKKAEKDLNRSELLYKKDIIAPITLEDVTLEYEIAKNNLEQFKKRHHSRWISQLAEYKNELLELTSLNKQLF